MSFHPTPAAAGSRAPSRVRPSLRWAVLAAAWLAAPRPAVSQALVGPPPPAPGALDPAFGTGGVVVTELGFSRDNAEAVVQQSDGKLVVAGRTFNGANFDFALARYNADGTLDATFGVGGKAVTDFAGANDEARGLDIQPDGKFVAAGVSGNTFALARYDVNGVLDPAFGTGGLVTTSFGATTTSTAEAVVVQLDGRIIAAGWSYDSANSEYYDFALARYDATGVLDATFGTGGLVVHSFGASFTYDVANDVVLQSDGMIVAAGYSGSSFAVARYTTSGALDTGFGTGGRVTTAFPSSAVGDAVALQSDGMIVVAGNAFSTVSFNYEFAVARYTTTGLLDTGFGTGGTATTDVAPALDDRATSVEIQADGKIVTAGVAGTTLAVVRYTTAGVLDISATLNNGLANGADDLVIQADGRIVAAGFTGGDVLLARYDTALALDTTFASVGWVASDLRTGSGDRIHALVLQPDGKIVAGGETFDGQFTLFALARYDASGNLDPTFGAGGTVGLVAATGGQSFVHALALQPDGKIVAAGPSTKPGFGDDFSLVRFNSNGTLDATFGTGGVVLTDIGGSSSDILNAVVLQPDGKIVAAGYASAAALKPQVPGGGAGGGTPVRRAVTVGFNPDFVLARYNPDGTADTTFNGGGAVATDFGAGNTDKVNAVALQADGKIVAGGVSFVVSSDDFALARYNPDGTLDATFGAGGLVTTDIASLSLDEIAALAVQPDGKIVAAGFSSGMVAQIALARYNPNGTLDAAFGTGGIVTTSIAGSDEALALSLAPDGRILVAGFAGIDFAAARYLPNGALDAGFGSGGIVRTPLGSTSATANALALQPDGYAVAAGRAFFGSDDEFTLVRYVGGLAADLSLSMTASPNPVLVNGALTYTLSVANLGPDEAPGVAVTEILPAGTTLVSASASQGTVSGTGTLTAGLGTIAAGGTATVTIVVTSPSAGSLTNDAGVFGAVSDPNRINDTASVVTSVVLPTSDLALTMTDVPDPVLVGGALTYTLTVVNGGPDPAPSVAVTDTLPAGVTLVSAVASQGSVGGTTTLSASLGSLSVGASATVTIVVSPPAVGSLVNSAGVSAAVIDPNSANDGASAVTTVTVLTADLRLSMTGTTGPVPVGANLSYTLNVVNGGPDAASSAVITDTLPVGAVFTSATASQGSVSGTSPLSVSLGTIPVGGTATVTIVAVAGSAGNLTNVASVAGGVFDPVPSDNSASLTTPVVGSLTAAAGTASPGPGVALAGAPDVPILQVVLQAGNEGADVSGMEFFTAGAGSLSGIAGASLWCDVNGNGVADSSDLGPFSGSFSPTPSPAFFFSLPTGAGGVGRLAAGTAKTFLLTFDLSASASPGATFGAILTGTEIFANGVSSGRPLNATVLPVGPSLTSSLLTVSAPATAATSSVSGGATVADFIMFSASIDTGATGFAQIEAQLGPLGSSGNWRLFRFDPSTGLYDEFGETNFTSKYPTMNPAFGWWLIARNAGSLSFTGTSTAVTNPNGFSITLRPGWNQVGNPYTAALPLALVEVNNVPLTSSSNAATLPSLYAFSRGSYFAETAGMQAKQGYWMKNVTGSPVTVFFERPPNALKAGEGVSQTRPLAPGEEAPPSPPALQGGTGLASGGGGGACFAAGSGPRTMKNGSRWLLPALIGLLALAGRRRAARGGHAGM